MGALIAVAGKTNESAFATATTMLDALSHRGGGSFGIASAEEVIVKETVEELRNEHIGSAVLIGHSDVKLVSKDRAQPIRNEHCTFALEGQPFPSSMGKDARVAAKLAATEHGASCLIRELDGSYVFVANADTGIIAGRDVIGARPLYYGENKRICAVASERKALWKVGVTTTHSFPPGALARIDTKGFRFAMASTLKQPPVQEVSLQSAARQVAQTLTQSVENQVSDVKEVALAFSGGVDSCVLAHLVRVCGVKSHLIFVALRGAREVDSVRAAADFLGLPLHIAEYSDGKVEELLPDVLWLTEDPSPVSASIALPLFWVAEQAVGLGLHVLLTGHGADELFGGYARYLREYERHGQTGLRERIYRDIVSSHAVNLERDDKVCAFHKVELRMPFNSMKVINLALSLPVGLNIASFTDRLRKRVLRQVARDFSIPEVVSERPKKAIQYTTGVISALRKLAARERLALHEYTETVFRKTCELREDD